MEILRIPSIFKNNFSFFCEPEHPKKYASLRLTLMGTKNLHENEPNPFFVFVLFNLMGTRMVQIRIAKSV